MANTLVRRLGGWFGQLSLLGKLDAILGAYLAIAIPFTLSSILTNGEPAGVVYVSQSEDIL